MKRVLLIALTAVLAPAWADTDPPTRVGRLSLLQGEVTFHNTSTGEAEPAVLNWPIASDAALETAPGGRAEVRIGSSTIGIDGASTIEFAAVDDERVHLRLHAGTVSVRIRSREQLAHFAVATPQGEITFLDVGRYRLDHDRTPDLTALTVHQGAARFENSEGAFTVAAGRRAEMAGSDFRLVAAALDDFDEWTAARERRDDLARSARYTSSEMTGYEDLDEYGEWREVEEHGPVWAPYAVPADWAPYRVGRWAWIDPWGWTWVDEAPWGFAPFHYGRWVMVQGRWCWVPGPIVARPAYAPALVAWLGRPGWQAAYQGGTVPTVGWFPLGPREAFHPSYRCSVQHMRKLNPHSRTVAASGEVRGATTYMHRHVPHAVTVAPQQVVASGGSIALAALRVRDSRELAALSAAPVVSDPSIVPQRVHGEANPIQHSRGSFGAAREQRALIRPGGARTLVGEGGHASGGQAERGRSTAGPAERGSLGALKRDWPRSTASRLDASRPTFTASPESLQERWRRADEPAQPVAPRAPRIPQEAAESRHAAPEHVPPQAGSIRPSAAQRVDGARTPMGQEVPRSPGSYQGARIQMRSGGAR